MNFWRSLRSTLKNPTSLIPDVSQNFRDYISSEFGQDYDIQEIKLDERSFCNIGEPTKNGVVPTYWVRFVPEVYSSDVIAVEKFLGWSRPDTVVRSYGRFLGLED